MSGRGRGAAGGGLLSLAVKGVASGIGLASEGIHTYKENKREKKAQKAAASRTTTHDGSGDGTDAPPPYEFEGHDRESPIRGGDENTHSAGENEKDPRKDWHGNDLEDEEYPPEYEFTTEEQWDLDDAQDELHDEPIGAPAPLEQVSTRDIGQLAENFIRSCPPPLCVDPAALSVPRLPLPVFLPQRRPKNRSRGFVRAYAPSLEPCGINQATWMAFLDTFDKVSAASPWLNAINLAGIATILLPTGFGILVSIAIQASVKAAKEIHSRHRTNTFLDKINTGFFRPRGLYCLVMTWKPDDSSWHQSVDLTSTISSSIQPSSNPSGHSNSSPFEGSFSNLTNKLKASSGVTYASDLDFPQAAPLVFPALEQLGKETGAEAVRKRDKIKVGAAFVTDYLDRRARAEYNVQNPNSVLAQGPQEKFSSRYADPNHPANSGSLVSLVTGGHVNPQGRDPRRSQQFGWERGGMTRERGGLGGPLGLVGGILGRGGGRSGFEDRGAGRHYGRSNVGPGYGAGYGRNPAARGSLGPGRYAEYEDHERQDWNRNRMGGGGCPRGGQYAEYEHLDQQYGNGRINPPGMPGDAAMGSSGYGAEGGTRPGFGSGPRSGPRSGLRSRFAGIGGPNGGGPLGVVAEPVKNLFKSDVLYLMVVNMPSEEEMNAAIAMMNRAQGPDPARGSAQEPARGPAQDSG